jgi:hypothetical protein
MGRRASRSPPTSAGCCGACTARLCDQLDGRLPDPGALVDTRRPPWFVHGDLHAGHVFLDPASRRLVGVIDFTDSAAGDPRYDLVARSTSGTFQTDEALLAACLDGSGWPDRPATWARELLAFTLLPGSTSLALVSPPGGVDVRQERVQLLWRVPQAVLSDRLEALSRQGDDTGGGKVGLGLGAETLLLVRLDRL